MQVFLKWLQCKGSHVHLEITWTGPRNGTQATIFVLLHEVINSGQKCCRAACNPPRSCFLVFLRLEDGPSEHLHLLKVGRSCGLQVGVQNYRRYVGGGSGLLQPVVYWLWLLLKHSGHVLPAVVSSKLAFDMDSGVCPDRGWARRTESARL